MPHIDSVGIYNFTSGKDWEKLDFPLKLWLQHTRPLVDQISLVVYGDMYSIESALEANSDGIRIMNNLKITYLPLEDNNSLAYSFKAMTLAMEELSTTWKLQIPIDEFLSEWPNFDGLDQSKAYCPTIHNLYGNINTELVGGESITMLPFEPSRFHYGNQTLVGDSGDVGLPKGKMTKPVHLWHTGYCRKPSALSNRLRTKVRNEVTYGIPNNRGVLQYTDKEWDYRNWRLLWPNAGLKKVEDSELPKILVENKERFNKIQW